jgi:hypothetical protein
MAEFKFSCPQCGQNIRCDVGYSGLQINCPACKQAIVVPRAPQAAAPPPPPPPSIARPAGPATPPPPPPAGAPGLATRQSTMAPSAGQRFSGAPGALPPKPKSHAVRNTIIIAAIVLGLAILGAGAWFVVGSVQKVKSRFLAGKGNPAAIVPTPTAAASSAALDIMAKVHDAYTNLGSLTVEGSSLTVIDMSDVTPADVNPNANANANARNKNSARRAANMIPKGMTNSSDVSIKLARPRQFLVEGKGKMNVGAMTMTNTMAAWSAGGTNFIYVAMGRNRNLTYSTDSDATMAMMSQGGGGLATSIMTLFFGDDNPMAQFISGQDCYTITAKMLGQKLKMWVNKSNYMIIQSEVTLGAPVSDTELQDMMDTVSKKADRTPADIQKQKATATMMAAMMTKIRGTVTETYDTVQMNPSLTADDFNYPIPAGVKATRGP